MNKLQEKFMFGLQGQLSHEKTMVDVNVAVGICKNEILAFNSFLRENYEQCRWNRELYESNDNAREFTTEQILEIYLNKE